MPTPEKNISVHHLTSQQFQLMTHDTGHVHRHNFFEIIWFSDVNETSILELDFESHILKNNQICIIAPGQVFNMKLRGEMGYVLAISREIFKEACNIETNLTGGTVPFLMDAQSKKTSNTII